MASVAADGARSPKFSVVIPARNGSRTLRSTLLTCLSQDFDDFEIVVADNASTDGTREVVEALASDKIQYFRSEESLSMTANWNRALSYARGDWITFLGSDDGLCPNALTVLDEVTQEYSGLTIQWPWAVYQWPDFPTPGQANKLSVPLFQPTRMTSSEDRLLSMVSTGSWPIVPHTYHALVHRSLVDGALKTGPVFDGIAPDLFSGAVFAFLTDEFLEVSNPLTVLGQSAGGNSVAHFVEGGDEGIRRDFQGFRSKAGISPHADLPNVLVGCIGFWDAIFRARDRLFPDDDRFRVDRTKIAQTTLDQIPSLPTERRQTAIAEVLDFLRTTEDGTFFVPELPGPLNPGAIHFPALGPIGSTLDEVIVDASNFGVHDVAGACELVGQISKLEPIIASRDGMLQYLVAERDAYLAERDSVVIDRDSWATQAKALAAERDTLIADREYWVEQARTFAQQRDALLTQRTNEPEFP